MRSWLTFIALGSAAVGCQPDCTPSTCGPTVGMHVRQVISAQEIERARNGRFAESLEALGIAAVPPVRLQLLFADSAGWVVRGTHDLLPGEDCVAWDGVVPDRPRTARGRLAVEPGDLYCDFAT